MPQINGSNGSQEEDEDDSYSPPIGPFLQTLFSRLEAFCENDVFTNLQLTGLISRLAAYPQPLLRSFLLNPCLVFQNVKNLSTILSEISKKLDQMSTEINNFEDLVRKARHFLFVRENTIINRKLSISAKLETEMFSNGYNTNSRAVRSNSITSLSSQTGTEGINNLLLQIKILIKIIFVQFVEKVLERVSKTFSGRRPERCVGANQPL